MLLGPVLRKNARALRDDGRHERLSFDLAGLRECDVRGLAIRFAFGFVVAVLVGIVTNVWGDRLGGIFLAFPAILPAALTLIAEQEGEREARVDAGGAVIGGVALSVFGFTSWFLLARIPVGWSELGALGVWTAVSIGSYVFARSIVRR